ncbi:MAG: hypothetical protein KAJ95_00535 [Gammaproteobacteria bacterium]|nr:hypothetical protein [Gammaproteobacteria bacterium]
MSLMFLDIATIPDFWLGERLYNLHGLSEKDISRVMATKNREAGDVSGMLPQHMQRVLAISVLFQDKDSFKVWSVGDAESDEGDLLKILQRYTDEYKPAVVTWCGDESIFPVLNFRYLSHGTQSPLFTSHTNLLSELARSSNKPYSLHEVAVLAGSPGNMKMSCDEVLNSYLKNDVEPVRNNLELKLIDTWLIYQRWQLVIGKIDQSTYESEIQLLMMALKHEEKAHLINFVANMDKI